MTKQELLSRVNEGLEAFGGKLLMMTKSGSHLYGTNTPTSDEDYLGVFLASPEFHLGFKTVEEVDLSIKDKDASGKNTENAVDIKVYELKKFLKLAGDVNPNIVELLFAYTNPEAIVFNSPEFELFQNRPELFINQRVYHSFMGYAKSQLKKGRNKPQNYKDLKGFKETLEEFIKTHDGNMTLGELQHYNEFAEFKHLFKKDGVKISNLTFPRNIFIKKALKMINEKFDSSSHRAKQWEEFGYDAKFFMHLFRLLDEGENLIKNRKLTFPLENTEFLLKVRNGEFSLEELEKMMESRFEKFESLNVSNLPKKAKWNELEKMFLKILKKDFCKEKK